MNRLKNNQPKSFFSFKNDTTDLVELGQFLRDTTKYRVEREWYVVFDKKSGKYMGYTKTVPNNVTIKVRNPDIILIDKKTKKLVLVIEVDGDIHRVKYTDTLERNFDYEFAKVPLLVIDLLEVDKNIFDFVTRKIQELGY